MDAEKLFYELLADAMPEELDAQIDLINAFRRILHEEGPFVGEPVDLVQWVKSEGVSGNEYNPNAVAPPEMELLRLSIMADGYTQPIVADLGDEGWVVVDGFHRNRVGKECDDVRERVHGYLPVVQIRTDRLDKSDRMASTIRHNRARGKHQVVAMSDIVMELKRRNWSDARVGKELGMDPDEVLRLTQITGLAAAFADRDFSEAWEHTGPVEEDAELDDDGEPVNLEWMRGMASTKEPGWHDRTPSNSVLYGDGGARLGAVQKSRFADEWFWYAYTQPMSEGRAPTLDEAKGIIESAHA